MKIDNCNITDVKGALGDLSVTNHSVNWRDEPAWVVDAIRGSVLATGWRGTLFKYFNDNPIQPMAWDAIDRLNSFEESDWPWCVELRLGIIGLGTYGWKYDPKIIQRAIDGGLWFIDTAESYGYGKVEKVLGSVFEGRDVDLCVASKVQRNHLSYQSTLNACGRSLERLKIPSLFLYQIHKPNPKFPIPDTMKAMIELYNNDFVDHVGVCNYSIDQLCLAQNSFGNNRIRTIQVRYNLMDRGIERALLPYCQQNGIMVIAYSPLGQNFKKFLANDVNGVLSEIAQDHDATEAQVALAWLTSVEGVIPIPRTNNLEHVYEIIDAQSLELSEDDIELLDAEFPIKE